MKATLLALPLALFVGCTDDGARAPAATAPASAVAKPAPAPAVAAPAPAAVVAAPKAAPAPVTVELKDVMGPGGDSAANFGFDEGNSRIFMYSNGAVGLPLKIAADGDYELTITAACDEADGNKAKFSVSLDDQVLAAEVTTTDTAPKDYVVKVPGAKAGAHKVSIAFLNDLYKENAYDLNMYVHGVVLKPAK